MLNDNNPVIKSKLMFSQLLASCEKYIFRHKRGELERDSLIAKFIDSKGIQCKLYCGKRYELYIRREDTTIRLNNMCNFTEALDELF